MLGFLFSVWIVIDIAPHIIGAPEILNTFESSYQNYISNSNIQCVLDRYLSSQGKQIRETCEYQKK